MTPISCQHAIIISKLPVMQTGLGCIISRNLPDYEVSYCRSQEELTLLQLRRANVVIADISGDQRNPRRICEEYYSLQNHYRDIHWIFLVSRRVYPCAVELLLRPESSLLSDIEPIEGVINAIRGGSQSAERISQTLLKPELEELDESRA